jgi:hypothetical protein
MGRCYVNKGMGDRERSDECRTTSDRDWPEFQSRYVESAAYHEAGTWRLL